MSKLTDLLTGVRASPDYLQVDGSIGLTGEPHTDNQFLFTSTYHAMVKRLGGNDVEARVLFDVFISEHQNPGRPGLYTPPPSWDVPVISHDEIVGISTYDPVIAADIAHYGIWHGWLFNNLDYKWTIANLKRLGGQWVGRMGWVAPYVRICGDHSAGLTPFLWLFNQFTFLLQCWFTSRTDSGDTSTRCMFYLMSQIVLTDGTWAMKKGMGYFLKDCTKRYGDLSGLYKIYFGPVHPITIAAQGMPFDFRDGNGE